MIADESQNLKEKEKNKLWLNLLGVNFFQEPKGQNWIWTKLDMDGLKEMDKCKMNKLF